MTVVRADIGHETRTTVGQILKMQQQLTTPTVRMEAPDGILISRDNYLHNEHQCATLCKSSCRNAWKCG